MQKRCAIPFLIILACFAAFADEVQTVQTATKVFNEIMAIPEKGIPTTLLNQAEAVAVIPNVVKAAFTIGGRYGEGVVTVKGKNGNWGPPSFIRIAGGSIGWQAGVESADLVLLIRRKETVNDIMRGNFTLGGSASVAAGPLGRQAAANTDLKFEAEVLSYSRTKGLFAGLAIEGSSLKLQDDSNRKLYGQDVKTSEIVEGKITTAPSEAADFAKTVAKYANGKKNGGVK